MKNGCCIKSLIMEIMRNPKPLARQNTALLIRESEVYLGPCQGAFFHYTGSFIYVWQDSKYASRNWS